MFASVCKIPSSGLGQGRLLRGLGFGLELGTGIPLGLFTGFLTHQVHLQGAVDGAGSTEFVVGFLTFTEGPCFAFHVVVGLGEIFIRQEATDLFERVPRETFQGLLKVGMLPIGGVFAQRVIAALDLLEVCGGIIEQSPDLQHKPSEGLQGGMLRTEILEDLRFGALNAAMGRMLTGSISILDGRWPTHPQIAMMPELGLDVRRRRGSIGLGTTPGTFGGIG